MKVNSSKTKLSLVGCVPHIKELELILSCGVDPLPSSYLGLPLGAKTFSKAIWNPVREWLEKRLSSWKGRYLSKGKKSFS